MPWGIAQNMLSPQQERALDGLLANTNRPQWLRGFAGTGKTVLMVFLAERLLALDPHESFCFVSFTNSLNDLVSTGFHGESAIRIKRMTAEQFLRKKTPFKYVLVDEVQDIYSGDLEKIRQLSTHLFLSGDPDQSIYDVDCPEQHIMDSMSPRVHVLTEIFRLTQTLLDIAVSVYPPAANSAVGTELMGGKDSSVNLVPFSSSRFENAWVFQEASKRSGPRNPSVVLLPNHLAVGDFARDVSRLKGLPDPEGAGTPDGGKNFSKLNSFWKEHDIPLMYLGNGFGSLSESENRPLVYLMTLHSAKGLDFQTVFLPGMGKNSAIWAGGKAEDKADSLRRLLFVALTRSRCDLFISFDGEWLHETMTAIPKELVVKFSLDGESENDAVHDGEWI